LVGSIAPGANERKLLADWVRSPRVRQQSGRLCIAAAATDDDPRHNGKDAPWWAQHGVAIAFCSAVGSAPAPLAVSELEQALAQAALPFR